MNRIELALGSLSAVSIEQSIMGDREENIRKISQFMLARGCVTKDEFHTFVGSLRIRSEDDNSEISEETVMNSVASMNGKLKRFNMMIRATVDDETQLKYFSLISTIDNAITKEATHHSAKEFDFFRQVWEAVKDEPISIQRAREMANSIKLNNCDDLLETWCEKLWLMKRDGEFRLGPRSKAELDVLVDQPVTQTL